MNEKLMKIDKLLEQSNIDIILVNSPENIFYLTGLTPNQLTVSRNPNFAGLIFNREDQKLILSTMDYENATFESQSKNIDLRPYTTWVGLKTEEELRTGKESVYDFRTSVDVLTDSIKELYPEGKFTLGLELEFITSLYLEQIKTKLPNAEIKNISQLFIKSRAIKTEEEIEAFRNITKVQDEALTEMTKHIKVGISEKELVEIYRQGIYKDGRYLPSGWIMLGFGENSSRLSRPTDRRLKISDAIRFDGGSNADFEFYTTDFSRSWLMPEADDILKRTKKILYNAQRKMIKSIKPGMKFSELFNLGMEEVKKDIPNYTRGHLGHSISLGPQTAEYPVINKDNHDTIEKNMILCVEVPLYTTGLSGFNIEDMILVTEDGCEVLTHRTPHILEFENL